jgi:hypothetical protein
MKRRIIKLHEAETKRIRILADRIKLGVGAKRAVVTVTRTGDFFDPRYGRFSITADMLQSMVRNFDGNTYGQKIILDTSHRPDLGAAGFFERLFLEGNKLRAEVSFTDFGLEAVTKRGMIYLSAEYIEDFVDNEHGEKHGATLLGAALTPRPVIKHLDPIDPQCLELTELGSGRMPVLVSERVIRTLSEEAATMKHLIAQYRKHLSDVLKLSEAAVNALVAAFEQSLTSVTDESVGKSLMTVFEVQAKALAEQIEEARKSGKGGEVVVKLDVGALEDAIKKANPGAPAVLDAAAVRKILAEDQTAREKTAAERDARKEANKARFESALTAAKGLSEDTRKALREAVGGLITADLTDAQVDQLATSQITLGNKMEADAKKLSLGLPGPTGAVQITVDERNTSLQLQQEINTALRRTAVAANGGLRLAEKVSPVVQRILDCFDVAHGYRLAEEAKRLAGGPVNIADTSLPASVVRTVIREALSDLNVLDLVQVLTDGSGSPVIQVPYETRDTSAVFNDGVVYEGGAIHRAGVAQALDPAYVVPMKIAMLVSNEVMHFTRSNTSIDWDAWARNIESNARVLRELVQRRICNYMQRVSDAYLAAAIANEDFGAQLDGAEVHTIKTVQFPIVRPHQVRDLAGNAVGAAQNPIVVLINSVNIPEWDGTGTQAAGTYFRVTNYNLGYIQFVDEAGDPVTPAATGNNEYVSYSHATNLVKFDIDFDDEVTTLEKHLNGLLRAIGARKAMMKDDRFVSPNFLLMSNTLNDTCSNAEQFVVSLKRDGTGTTTEGDLGPVKSIPSWATNAPGVDLGDERILMGVRGTCAYGISKPYSVGQPFEAVDSNGRPIGKKQAYGEEYSAIHVPTPVRNRFTSVLVYSATSR